MSSVAMRKARERASRFAAREKQLVELAASFETASARESQVRATFERRRRELEAAEASALGAARASAARVVHAMCDELKVSRAETAERLGIDAGRLREYLACEVEPVRAEVRPEDSQDSCDAQDSAGGDDGQSWT